MFKEIRRTELVQYNGEGILLQEEKTGMQVFHIKNNSEELCGIFAFSTPSEDSTGVAHILEHTVLCGSELYPLKDPFLQIVNSSPNTFLNAMTFPDKTVFPFASPLKKDFDIIFSVYADALFSPLLRKQSFEQEGVRFFNNGFDGVVFNEMMASYYTEESLLLNSVFQNFFKGTPAQYESGGEPVCIADLTYEQYLQHYFKWYSPSNCCLFLYGNLNLSYYLDLVEKRYLTEDKLKKWTNRRIIPKTDIYSLYPSKKMYNEVLCPEKTVSSVILSWITGSSSDPFSVFVLSLLTDLLLSSPSCPLYKAVTDSGFGLDLHSLSGMSSETPYMTFTVGFAGVNTASQCKKTSLNSGKSICKEEIEQYLLESLKKISDKGFSEKEIEALIRREEFKLHEIQGSGIPYGIKTGLECIKYWLRGVEPHIPLFKQNFIQKIKKEIKNGAFFENSIRKFLIENPLRLLTVGKYDSDFETRLKKQLDNKYKKRIKKEQKKSSLLFEEEKHKFELFVNTADSSEKLASIPKISLSDFEEPSKICKKYDVKTESYNNFKISVAPLFTNSVVYVKYAFKIDYLENKEIEMLPLFMKTLQNCGTDTKSFSRISNEFKLLTGGFSVHYEAVTNKDNSISSYLVVSVKCLEKYLSKALSLVNSILCSAQISKERFIKTSLNDLITETDQSFIYYANRYAVFNALSHINPVMRLTDLVYGISAWLNMRKLREESFEKGFEQIAKKLVSIYNKVFVKNDAIFEICCDEEKMDYNVSSLLTNIYKLKNSDERNNVNLVSAPYKFDTKEKKVEKRNSEILSDLEIFTLSSGAAYNAMVMNLYDESEENLVADVLLLSMIESNWLWDNVRSKGGAYGVESHVNIEDRFLTFSSYRDPLITETYKIFYNSFKATFSEENLENAKVTILGKEKKTVTPSMFINTSLQRLLYGISDEDYKRRCTIMLNLTLKDIYEASKRLNKLLNSSVNVTICGAEMAKKLSGKKTELPL